MNVHRLLPVRIGISDPSSGASQAARVIFHTALSSSSRDLLGTFIGAVEGIVQKDGRERRTQYKQKKEKEKKKKAILRVFKTRARPCRGRARQS